MLLVVFGACSSIAPVPIRNGEVCFRCRRVIVDSRLAAQTISGGLVSNFRTSGCLAKYLADHKDDKSALFVSDYATGKLIPADLAYFVPTVDRDTGEKDYMAFSSRSAADAEAFSRKASWVRWNAVIEKAATGN
jgi:hypothetical protein